MGKLDGMIERLKKGEAITTKDMDQLGKFHSITAMEAGAVVALHLATGKLVETVEGYEAAHDGPSTWDGVELSPA